MAGFFEASLDPAQPDSYEAIQRKRKLAEALMKQGTDTAPVQSWTQGVARLMQALAGKLSEKELDAKEAAANKAFQEHFLSAYSPASASSAGSAAPAATSGAPAASSPPKASAAAPTTFDPNALPTFAKAAGDQFGVSPDYMAKTAWIESRFNPQADNGVAKGLYQFIPSTAKAYGLADPFDAQASATAAARLAADNREALSRSLGRAPNDAELYLAHQQGAGGAAKLLANPNAPAASIVGRQAVIQNGGRPDMTAGEFANLWIGKFNALQPRGAVNNTSAQQPSSAMAYAPAKGRVPPEAAAAIASASPGAPPSAIPVGLPPGAVPQNAQPAPTQPDPALLAATAARAANPQPGDQMAALGSPEEQAFTRIEGQPGAAGRSGLAAALAGSGTPPGAQPRIDNVTPTAAGSSVRFSNSADDVKQPAPSTSATPAPSDRSRALLMMALNPALSPSQRQMAATAVTALQAQDKVQTIDLGSSIGIMDARGNIVRQIPKEAAPKWEKLNDGTLYDSRTGQTRAATGGPAFRALVDPAERARYGIPANDQKPYQVGADGKLSAVGSNGTNVSVETKTESAFDQSIAKSQAELFTGVATDGMAAKGDLASIQSLRQNISKLPGGFLGGAQAIAKGYGINIGPNTSNLEAANAILNKLVPAQRQGMPGAASDRDVQMFKDALPKLSNSPEGNKTIMDTMEALTRHKIAAGEIANRVMTGEMSRKDAMRALQELPDPMAMFKEAQKLASNPGATTQQVTPPAGQFSPDEIAAELARRGLK